MSHRHRSRPSARGVRRRGTVPGDAGLSHAICRSVSLPGVPAEELLLLAGRYGSMFTTLFKRIAATVAAFVAIGAAGAMSLPVATCGHDPPGRVTERSRGSVAPAASSLLLVKSAELPEPAPAPVRRVPAPALVRLGFRCHPPAPAPLRRVPVSPDPAPAPLRRPVPVPVPVPPASAPASASVQVSQFPVPEACLGDHTRTTAAVTVPELQRPRRAGRRGPASPPQYPPVLGLAAAAGRHRHRHVKVSGSTPGTPRPHRSVLKSSTAGNTRHLWPT